MRNNKPLSRGGRITRLFAYIFGGVLVIVGVLVLSLARDWAGVIFLVIGGLFIWMGRKYVGPQPVKAPSTQTVATKIEDYSKWQWFDYLIFAVLGLVVVLAIRPEVNFFIKLLIWFGCGAVAGIIYHLTLHTLWTNMFPNLYRRWVCSKCHAVVSKEATKCQGCDTQFGEKRAE